MAKCRYHWRKLGGLGHRLGNFVCLCSFSKTVLNKCKNIGSQWMCRTDFEMDIVGSNLELTHVQTLWGFPWKGVMHLFEVSAPFNKCISFKMIGHPIEVGHVLVYFMSKMNHLAHAMPFSQYFLKSRTHGTCKHVKYVLHNCTSFFWMHNVIFFQDNAPYFGNNTLWCRQLSSWKIL